ncbi:hypothetical protein DN545_34380, partial [Burkholderia multivorans]
MSFVAIVLLVLDLMGTFVFAIGDRFFGVLNATAHEQYAARYDFTRAMAVQLLKSKEPALAPLIE